MPINFWFLLFSCYAMCVYLFMKDYNKYKIKTKFRINHWQLICIKRFYCVTLYKKIINILFQKLFSIAQSVRSPKVPLFVLPFQTKTVIAV